MIQQTTTLHNYDRDDYVDKQLERLRLGGAVEMIQILQTNAISQ